MTSIYRGWGPHLGDIIRAEAAAQQRDAEAQEVEAPPIHLRRAQPVLDLLPRTRQWLEAVPDRVRPHALSLQFARIANRLCAAWDDPADCLSYFDDLLVDKRPMRKGFPVTVLRELHDLRAYYVGMLAAQLGKRSKSRR